MISEDYVSFETAKLLKEKGFDEKCRALYNKGKLEFYKDNMTGQNHNIIESTNLSKSGVKNFFGETKEDLENSATAPTQALVVKWLRIKYGIHIHAGHNPNKYSSWIRIDDDENDKCLVQTCIGYDFKSHEEAIESAIKYSLENLVK